MLNRTKLISQVQDVSSQLFVSFAKEHTIARGVWQRIARDPTFASRAKAADLPWRMPTWSGNLDDVFEVEPGLVAYHAVSVDGSQIYPDRHQGTACYLINVGSVGQPRDNDPRASYVIHDTNTGDIEYHRIPYDIKTAQEKMEQARLPELLIERLAVGH